MYLANADGKFRVAFDSTYNWVRKRLPMAWFYKGTREDIKIYTYPKGWRGWWVVCGRPFKWVPCSAEQSVPFIVNVEFKTALEHQIDMQIYLEGGDSPIVAGSVLKGETKTILDVDAHEQHDDGNLLYSLHVNTRGGYRVVRSAPIPDNYLIIGVAGTLLGITIKWLWDLLISAFS
jgi:hypothetical protein